MNYHQVSETFIPGEHIENSWTSIDNFCDMVRWLKSHNYHFISLSEMIRQFNEKEKPAQKQVCFTFDDGYRSILNVTNFLKEEKIPVTFFINTAYLDNNKHNWVDLASHVMYMHDNNNSFSEDERECARKIFKTKKYSEFKELQDRLESLFSNKKPVSEWLTHNDLEYLSRDNNLFTFSLHGHEHLDSRILPLDIFERNLDKNIEILSRYDNFVPLYAFPFGRWTDACTSMLQSRGLTWFYYSGGVNNKLKPGYNRAGIQNQRPSYAYLAKSFRPEKSFINTLYRKIVNISR